MTDLFLSYKAEDRARVAPLVQALETDGLSVWWDAHIGGGDEWRDTILRHLEAARAVIVVWSRRSVGPNGQFVRDEAARALKRGTYLPVRIDKVDPPLGFGETQALELHGWKGDRSDARYEAVLATLRNRLGIKGRRTTHESTTREGVPRRTVVIGSGAVLATAAAGAGAWFLSKPRPAHASSIAVLPFANLSGDPQQTYFSDGIAEELRAALARIAGLKVVARTSSEAVREEDAKSAAARLHVDNILSGSVRRSAGMLRINAQLVDGRDGTERWSEAYDRARGDALQIQTDIANKVAEALSLRLGSPDKERILQGGTNNADAQDMLLKAEAYVAQSGGPEAWKRGIEMVDAAMALDPHYANALAARAGMLKVLAGGYTGDPQESQAQYREAEATARRAIALAPQSARSHSVLGDILYEQLHPRAALAQYQKAMSLNGEDVAPLGGYAVFLGENGRTSEALALVNRIISSDPLNPYGYALKATTLGYGRRYPEAIASVHEVMRLSPGRTEPMGRIGSFLTLMGRCDEARRALQAGSEDSPIQQVYRATLAARTGNKKEAENILAQVREIDAANYQAAEILAQLGREDEAIAALETAWRFRDSGLTTIQVDPLLDPLRGDPRFESIVKRIDFPG